ncbi:glycoside hydrolase family 28 protein [Evansella sp. AB-P1]|uniref:glycoside hydrolase family 28 protein n=1 Tax=Evansella sp. AB-P1 TaxID=3037653 RepID=UPI00241F7147|nr:glycoside hydrolase family 28 protein [Evansella sp. AB-P1]MDG5787867.1 glycoside hydrolase family 28 protein [Evansella sp. AB-P1]
MTTSEKLTLPTFDVLLPEIPDKEFSITDFGAIGDGVHLNTEAFANAISACVENGGGKVVVPAGIWLTGPISLKSKLNLHVESGAVVLFSDNFDHYPLIHSTFEGEEVIRCQSPIDGEGLEDVAITGKGTFDGSGEAWRPVKRWKMTDIQWEKLIKSGGFIAKEREEIWWPTEQAANGAKILKELRAKGSKNIDDYQQIRDFLRPNMVSIRRSRRVLLEGPTFQNSPAWNVHPFVCQHVTMRNVTVRNPWFSQNGDGLDLEACRYAIVENCIFDVGDDAICIKSGKNEEGRKLGTPSEDITIRDCQVYSGHGGFVVGSEMSGGVRNVSITDCTFFGTDTGLRFKSTRGRGGVVENIVINNICMNNIKKEAIVFHMFYEISDEDVVKGVVPVTEETPIFRHVDIRNIVSTGSETAILMKGLPEMPLEGITFENLSLVSKSGITGSQCKDVNFSNVAITVENGPLFSLENCVNTSINQFTTTKDSNIYLQVSGEKTENMSCHSNLVDEKDKFVVKEGVNPSEVKLSI